MPRAELPRLPEWTDMQGLVLSAYSDWNDAVYLLFRFHDDCEREMQRWVRAIIDRITPVDKRRRDIGADSNNAQPDPIPVRVNIAFTHEGLKKLARCSNRTLEGFAAPFVEGISGTEHRRRILGDTGDNAPNTWEWGGTATQEDVLLMVFARRVKTLDATVIQLSPPPGVAQVRRIRASSRRELNAREHFGFVDGGSQPIIAGTEQAERFPRSIHITALGEFVLGYPNANGLPPDPCDIPALSGTPAWGRNGSYLVLRQIEQHVSRFWTFCKRRSNGDDALAERLAAKIVGRQMDGTPLVPNTSPTDNEFGYAEDAHGYGCPIGSHIRRANPRDSLVNNNVPSILPIETNVHRILRRGRPYGPPWDPKNPDDRRRGLVFLCLNSDIEQQFEFIQQNWINGLAFAGVNGERDPLIGGCDGQPRHFTVPTLPIPSRVRLPKPSPVKPAFVTVRGGEYFFMPGIDALREIAR